MAKKYKNKRRDFWYSPDAEQAAGSILWRIHRGGVVRVTAVLNPGNTYGWANAVCVGSNMTGVWVGGRKPGQGLHKGKWRDNA